jgi:CBS domain-containing protein
VRQQQHRERGTREFMYLKDVMKKKVEVVGPDTLLREAAHRMNAGGIPLLPVCEGLTMVGVLTTRDITVRATAQGCDPRITRVREVMMAPTIYGQENQNLDEAADLMERWSLYRLPVLNQKMELVGIVSLRDLSGNFVPPMTRRFAVHRRKRISKERRLTK